MSDSDVPDTRRRATALRRIVFIVYAAGVVMGTLWPHLQIGDPLHPPDKMLHFVCFGGMAFLFDQARYVKNHCAIALIGVTFTVIDEFAQAAPGIGRTFSVEDIWASASGVIVATSLGWATRPRGGGAALLRRRNVEQCLDALLARPMGWMAIASGAALGAASGVPLAVVIDGLSASDPTPFQAAVVGGLLGASAIGGAMIVKGVAREQRLAIERGTQIELPSLTWHDVIRACAAPIIGGFVTLGAGLVMWATLLYLSRDSELLSRTMRWFSTLSKGMGTMIDATIVGLFAAVVIDRCRARLTRRIDDGDKHCVGCGQDLRGTPAPNGMGRCSECGGNFYVERSVAAVRPHTRLSGSAAE